MKGEQNSEQLPSDTKAVELSERITSLETVAEEPEPEIHRVDPEFGSTLRLL
jgi:hypothetical protein